MLLSAGVASSVLYVVATDVVAAARWEHYSRTGQMVSDLFAVGSPGKPLLDALFVGYTVLMTAFGAGVWMSAPGNLALRAGGALLVAYGASNPVASLFPLDLADPGSVPMHIVVTNVQLALMVAAMGLVAAGWPGRFRGYTIMSLVTMVVMGIVAFAAAPQAPNLVLGIGERISIGAFLLWVAVLAVALWRMPSGRRRTAAGGRR